MSCRGASTAPIPLSRTQAPDGAAGRAALASGLAIGIAPFVLAQLSDAIGLRAAFLIVPVLLLVLAARAGRVYSSLPR